MAEGVASGAWAVSTICRTRAVVGMISTNGRSLAAVGGATRTSCPTSSNLKRIAMRNIYYQVDNGLISNLNLMA